jgi:hypothetical protein
MLEVYLVTIFLAQEKCSLKFETLEKLTSSKSLPLLIFEPVHRILHKLIRVKTMIIKPSDTLFFFTPFNWMKSLSCYWFSSFIDS